MVLSKILFKYLKQNLALADTFDLCKFIESKLMFN